MAPPMVLAEIDLKLARGMAAVLAHASLGIWVNVTIKKNAEEMQRHGHFHLVLNQSRVMGTFTGALVSSLVLRLLTTHKHTLLIIPSVMFPSAIVLRLSLCSLNLA